MTEHCWVLVEEKIYDKFNPKTSPIADYWQKYECSNCGALETEVGYIDGNGRKIPMGGSAYMRPSPGGEVNGRD